MRTTDIKSDYVVNYIINIGDFLELKVESLSFNMVTSWYSLTAKCELLLNPVLCTGSLKRQDFLSIEDEIMHVLQRILKSLDYHIIRGNRGLYTPMIFDIFSSISMSTVGR